MQITHLGRLKNICIPTLLLALCRILLLGGIAAAGIGYLGCFGLIQASNLTNVTGPGTWLAVEVTLCIIRLAIWASNPAFDDAPPPIAIRKDEAVTYNIGWMLDDVTSDDLHAVVIGIDETADPGIPKLECAVSDARSVKKYLENSLAVPTYQVKLLENATLGKITEALENMATDNTIRPRAPIVIYLASHAVYDSDSKLIFLTSEYKHDEPGTGLLYSDLLDLIHTISDNKGNNITVILDTCHAGSFGRNMKFDNDPLAMDENSSVPNEETLAASTQTRKAVLVSQKKSTPTNGASTGRKDSFSGDITAATTSEYLIGYSSHVLLAACSDANATRKGGAFTQCLLNQLENMETDAFKRLTYRGLVDNLRNRVVLEKYHQTPVVSGNFQNRLLFNGLLARKRLGRGALKETSVILISTDFDIVTTDPEKKWLT
ncbi:hypothetical protein GALMADRAFT_1296180 [Galerina marginata CBS 339.88]|uniref:Peptidase C14 caspase domain-containing protein n=1 Tax=Galerina marginata (strain CBS 339.88) TaxID=685588 RepID=A0A067T6P2_GALM3|nr:hypothetical protein GALMADRAFT_1296180 [Galerina marginata CBS 339.88]